MTFPQAIFLVVGGGVLIGFFVALARVQTALEALRHEAKLYGTMQIGRAFWDNPSTEGGKLERARLHRALASIVMLFLLLGVLGGISHLLF